VSQLNFPTDAPAGVGEFVARNARTIGDRPALVWQTQRLSWTQLDRRVNRLANALLDLGVAPGERIATLLDNCAAWIEIHLAASKIGAVLVPIMPRSVGREVAYIVEDVAPAILVIGAGNAAAVAGVPEQLTRAMTIVTVGETWPGAREYEELLASGAAHAPSVAVNPDAIAMIKYTSGTTGAPKGCCRTHRHVTMAALLYLMHVPHDRNDRATISSPLSAGFAVSLLNAFILAGTTIHLLPKFDVVQLLETIVRERITIAYAIQSTFNVVTRFVDLDSYDLGSLRLFTGTSGTQDTIVGMRRLRRHPSFRAGFLNAYGSSEAGGYIAYNTPDSYEATLADPTTAHRIESIGREAMLCRVACVDEELKPLPPGEVGEMAVRAPTVFSGYWNRPLETAAVFRQGWLVTGDMAMKDADGFLYLAGRKRDMIKTGGINVYPAEIELILGSHPKVAEVAVVGIPDPRWIEKVIACVVARESCSEAELLAFCTDKLSGYKRPKAIRFLTSLPRNELGKIVKRALRETMQNEGGQS
jgi:acyl-CoA synthetase (AMP-forming)/AMP-acid ligase II